MAAGATGANSHLQRELQGCCGSILWPCGFWCSYGYMLVLWGRVGRWLVCGWWVNKVKQWQVGQVVVNGFFDVDDPKSDSLWNLTFMDLNLWGGIACMWKTVEFSFKGVGSVIDIKHVLPIPYRGSYHALPAVTCTVYWCPIDLDITTEHMQLLGSDMRTCALPTLKWSLIGWLDDCFDMWYIICRICSGSCQEVYMNEWTNGECRTAAGTLLIYQ